MLSQPNNVQSEPFLMFGHHGQYFYFSSVKLLLKSCFVCILYNTLFSFHGFYERNNTVHEEMWNWEMYRRTEFVPQRNNNITVADKKSVE